MFVRVHIHKMKINEEKANGIVISGDNIVYAKAIRKPNANTNIIQEMWFKGSPQKAKELLNKMKEFQIIPHSQRKKDIDDAQNVSISGDTKYEQSKTI